jgi:hypothetical protein
MRCFGTRREIKRGKATLLPHFPRVRENSENKKNSKALNAKELNGRGDWIRTSDFYVPNVALYQAEPHPVFKRNAAL